MAILFKIGPKPDQGPLSGPGPVRFGPDPEDFSPVRSGTPGTLLQILPLFGNDTARQLFIDFTPFFRQTGQFLNFRNEIYKT